MKVVKALGLILSYICLFNACELKRDDNTQMVELLKKQDRFETNADNIYAVSAVLQQQDSIINSAGPGTDLFQNYVTKANVLLQMGREQEAVDILDSLNNLFIADYAQRQALLKNLAIAYMRLGERTNCINNHSAKACIYPIEGAGIHVDKYGSQKAIALYIQLLKNNVSDYESRWLLNIAYMTVGGYPKQVPAEYLLKIDSTVSNNQTRPFKDVAMRLGLAIKKMGGGSIIDDFDNDGYNDIITSSSNLKEPMHYFQNNKNGTFTDVAEQAGLKNFTGGLNIMQTDYNNDGFKDIFVLRGAWKGKFGKEPNSLLKNNGDGTFTDVTRQCGLLSFHPTQAATWADFNNDGWIDIFIGNESTDADLNVSELYINNKNGTFINVAQTAGGDVKLFVKGVTSGDYDNDGRTDIFISGMNGRNVLLKNVTPNGGAVKFTNATQQAGLDSENSGTFATWFWDYDNDGWVDIMLCGYGNSSPIAAIAGADALNQFQGNEGKNILFHNEHNGKFKDVSKETGVNKVSFAMGANFGDIDNDGFLDFYLGTGNPMFSSLIPDRLFKNEHGKKFSDITIPAKVGGLQKGHGISFADLNNDGNNDIFINQGGAFPGDAYHNALYINPGQNNNHWVDFILEGTTSNKLAIGAKLKVCFTDNGQKRIVYRDINSGGSFGSNPLAQHIGIGAATVVDSIVITWPVTKKLQRFTNIPVGTVVEIKEGQNKWSANKLRYFNFDMVKPADMGHMNMN
nr:CRTAC1 family protein [uncultured Mucilaginibacter sp.]